ncbi:MAG: hypothetical protein AAF999_13990 [Pseudomonadota bacterium]
MHSDLRTRRKLCIIAYAEYLKADRAWTRALALVPETVGHGYWRLGDRGSPLRVLYDRRDRALQKMVVSLGKFKTAKARLAAR